MKRIEHILLTITLIFIIILAVKMTAYIISLFLMAVILTMLGIPSLIWLKQKGLSDLAAIMIITLVTFLIIFGLISLTVLSLNTLITDLPQYQTELNTRVADIITMLAPFGLSSFVTKPPTFDLGQFFSTGIGGIMSIADATMFLFYVGILTPFMLFESPRLDARFEKHFGRELHTMQNLSRMIRYVIDFIVVRTQTNFVHGLLFGSFLGIIGIHGAILWGVLTFLLGFIPYFGLLIAAIPALFFAWLQYGIPGAVAVILAICVLNMIVEHPVLSFFAAQKFNIPAFLVLVSVIFWGWLLGLVGLLFAVPFTLISLLVFESFDELRWINVMLGVNHLFTEQDGGATEK